MELFDEGNRDLSLALFGDVAFVSMGWAYYVKSTGEHTTFLDLVLLLLMTAGLVFGMGLNFWSHAYRTSTLAGFLPWVGYYLGVSIMIALATDVASWPALNVGLLTSIVLALAAVEAGARSKPGFTSAADSWPRQGG